MLYYEKVMEHKNVNLYTFESEASSFCYDIESNNIYELTEENKVLIDFLINKNTLSLSKEKYTNKNAFINLCYSNTCNLNCTYCYRLKTKKASLSINEIEDIIDYVINVFNPEANGYIFSLGLTSEALLELDILREIERILYKYENYDFTEDDFIDIKPEELINNIPSEFVQPYLSNENTYLDVLNKIIHSENLNTYYKIPHDVMYSGFNSLIDNADLLSEYKLSLLNRKILEEIFKNRIKQKIPKFCNMNFMTNGTTINEESIAFLKSINVPYMIVSIDGPEEVHNYNRAYYNNNGSYSDVVQGVKKLIENNIPLQASCVISPKNIDVVSIFTHFRELGFNKVSFQLVRMGTHESFNENMLEKVLEKFSELFDFLYKEIKNDDYSLLKLLNQTLLFTPIRNIILDQRFETRCAWGDTTVIDTEGNLYPCMYVIGNKDYCYGNYKENILHKDILKPIYNDEIEKCKNCWARYLCGGTCHYNSIYQNGTLSEVNTIECRFRKEIISMSLKFFAKILKTEYSSRFIQEVLS